MGGGAGVSKTVCKTSHSNIQPSSPPPTRLIRSTYVSLVINRGNETFFLLLQFVFFKLESVPVIFCSKELINDAQLVVKTYYDLHVLSKWT